jgi:hypothetical protein
MDENLSSPPPSEAVVLLPSEAIVPPPSEAIVLHPSVLGVLVAKMFLHKCNFRDVQWLLTPLKTILVNAFQK